MWRVVRFQRGTFGVFTAANGAIVYHKEFGTEHFTDKESAQIVADRLNGKPVMPRRLSPADFEDRVGHVPMSNKMRHALHAILVNGWTWRNAAETFCVTESGVLRAMRRVASRNHA